MPDIRTIYIQLFYEDGTKSYMKCEMDIDDSIENQVFDLNAIISDKPLNTFTWSFNDWGGYQTDADTELAAFIKGQRTDK